MSEYYIYAYLRESNLTPYYIGKGKGRRAWQYHYPVSKPKNKNLIVILEANLTEVGSIALERWLIRWWGRKDLNTGILHNKTDGGDGTTNRILTEETKRKISQSHKGIKMSEESIMNMRLAKANMTASTRQKMSLAKKGKCVGSKNSNYGNKWTDEMKANMSALKKSKSKPRCWVTDGQITKLIDQDLKQQYVQNGFVIGRIYNK